VTTRVALLRGINLAGKKKVPMARLRELAVDLDMADPQTYVQSGNLVFETDLDESQVVGGLQDALRSEFGFEVEVITRSAAEMSAIASSHPFSDLGLEDRLLQVAFLDRLPEVEVRELIGAEEFAPDRLEGDGREVYLAYPGGSARSKLGHALLESRLGVSVTLRNWRTVKKLAEMTASRVA
jgi:uncharacterized protein (DUF1697 family)